MKFTSERHHFLAAVKSAHGAVERKNTIPVLACLHIAATDTGLQITGTNLDMTARASCQASVSQPGVSVASADDLLKWLTAAPAGSLIEATGDGNKLHLSAGRLSLSLPVFEPEAFTLPSAVDGCVEIPGGAAALAMVSDFHSREETRYYLNGVAFNQGHAVATDGHRAGVYPCAHDVDGIIPYKAFPLIFGAGETARLFLGENSWRVEAENLTITGKTIDGAFPDWTRIIPAHGDTMQVDADALMAACNAVTLGRATAVRLIGSDGVMRIEADKWGIGGAAGSTAEISMEGADFRALVSKSYLDDALKQFSGEVVTVSNNNGGMILITGKSDLRVVVMAMRDTVMP